MTARDALDVRIRFLEERAARQEANLKATRTELATLVVHRAAITDDEVRTIDALRARGVLTVER